MKLIRPKVEILDNLKELNVIDKIARVARTCYKSEDKSNEENNKKLVRSLLTKHHEAMLEFADITVKFICSRAISHEIVRHRMSSFAQESQRYCNYHKGKFNNEITFIIPTWVMIPEGNYSFWDGDWCDIENANILKNYEKDDVDTWLTLLAETELDYNSLINKGWQPQQAREVLPNSTKTEINMKANLREWRHFLKLRCSTAAHPDMRELALTLLEQFHAEIPIIFDDLYEEFIKEG